MSGDGRFVWYELLASDEKAAEDFYSRVLGWKIEDAGQPGIDYAFIAVDGARIGGMMTLPDEACKAGARPGWLGYVGVADADACAKAVEAKGGRVLRAAEDIPGYGRFAVLADPQGAAFCIIAPDEAHRRAPPSPAHRTGVPGFGGWHELYADDPAAAFEFYSSLFGWTKGEAIDLGEFGIYQLLTIGGVLAGGVMKRPPQAPKAAWNYYFNVESIDAAAARVVEAKGQVIHGPQEVPGGAWILTGLDSEGVVFSLVAPKR